MNTFGGFGGLSCSILMLQVKNFLPGSPSGPKQEAQRRVIETGQAGNNGQPVKETEVPTHYQNHLFMKRKGEVYLYKHISTEFQTKALLYIYYINYLYW